MLHNYILNLVSSSSAQSAGEATQHFAKVTIAVWIHRPGQA